VTEIPQAFPAWSGREADTLPQLLRRRADEKPDAILFNFFDHTCTYSEFLARAESLARGLIREGVQPGDTVATLLDNSIEPLTAWFGANIAGAIIVPINTELRGTFLKHQLADSGARVLIAESDLISRVVELEKSLPDLQLILHRGERPGVATAVPLRPLADALIESESELPAPRQPSDLTYLIYTSGTTGPSKGCMVSYGYAHHLAAQLAGIADRRADEVFMTFLPFYHQNAAMSAGGTIVVGGTLAVAPRFSVSRFWYQIEQSGARGTTLLGAPVQLLANAPDNEAMLRCKGQLRVATGAPFPMVLQKVFHERFGVVRTGPTGYGLTECSMVVSNPSGPGEWPRPDSSGRVNDAFDVRIVDDNDNEVPAGQAGEVIVRPRKPYVMFEGYWRRPEATVSAMRNLWFHTGDIGEFDQDGYFTFKDRKKDYLRRRGENISSQEMEVTFLGHPSITDVAVHSVSSDMGEDEVKVTAVVTAGSTITPQQLCEWSMDKVPYFAVPRYVEFRGDLPRNPLGKVLKHQLRDEGVTDATWDRELAQIEVERRQRG